MDGWLTGFGGFLLNQPILKNMSQIGNFLPQVGMKIKKYLSCHQLGKVFGGLITCFLFPGLCFRWFMQPKWINQILAKCWFVMVCFNSWFFPALVPRMLRKTKPLTHNIRNKLTKNCSVCFLDLFSTWRFLRKIHRRWGPTPKIPCKFWKFAIFFWGVFVEMFRLHSSSSLLYPHQNASQRYNRIRIPKIFSL